MDKNFNLERFNEEFSSGERFAIDYIYNTIIKYINKDFNVFTKDKTEIRNYYLLTLWNSVSYINECLWLYEEYNFDNNFNFDVYMVMRDKLFNELGLVYNVNAERWELK